MASGRLTLGFVGDIMLGRRVNEAIARRRPEAFWGDVLPLLRSADAVMANLECPITAHRRPWQRTAKAFRLRADPAAVEVLAAGNIRCVNLANNHILDHEESGLVDTLRLLDDAGIAYAGAGRGAAEALRPALFEAGGQRVGCIAVTDTMPEFCAGDGRAGTNYMRIDDSHKTLGLIGLLVDRLRAEGAARVVLSAHWGPNLRPWPPARYRRFARAVTGRGIDVLHGHSAHLFQGIEQRHGRLILYDTGDFLDDYWVFPFVRTDRSFLFLAEFGGRGLERLRLVPVTLSPTRVSLARGSEFRAICRRMRRWCRPFGTRLEDSAEGLELRPGSPGHDSLATRPLPAVCPIPFAPAPHALGCVR